MNSAENVQRLLQFSADPRSREAIPTREGHAAQTKKTQAVDGLGSCSSSPALPTSDTGIHDWNIILSFDSYPKCCYPLAVRTLILLGHVFLRSEFIATTYSEVEWARMDLF